MKKTINQKISFLAITSFLLMPLIASATPHQHLEIVKPETIVANHPVQIKIYFKEDDKKVKKTAEISAECATRQDSMSIKNNMKDGAATLDVTLKNPGTYLCKFTVNDGNEIWASEAITVNK